MKILVTGATGFIGRHAAQALARRGHDVIALSRRPLAADTALRGIRWVHGDIRQAADLTLAVGPLNAVVHCAGRLPGIGASAGSEEHEPAETLGALQLAVRAGATRFVHTSTLAVCDPPVGCEALDERSEISRRPRRWNGYARLKIAEERAVREAHNRGAIGVVVLRPGIVFGPGDRHATPLFLRALDAPFRFTVGPGDNEVACLVVEELAEALATSAERPHAEGRCYPLSGSETFTQRDLFRLHARAVGRNATRRGVSPRLIMGAAAMAEALGRFSSRYTITRVGAWIIGSPSRVDCSAAASDLGWSGASSVPEAISRAIEAQRGITNGGRP